MYDGGKSLMINLSMVAPNLTTSFALAIGIKVDYHNQHYSDGYIHVAATSSPVPPDPFPTNVNLFPIWAHDSGALNMIDVDIKKALKPKPGVFYGFHNPDEHTVEVFELLASGIRIIESIPLDWFGWTIMTLHITDTSVTVMRPKSMISQFLDVLSGIGGSIAMVSTIFFVFFAKRFKRTAAEERAQELTLNLPSLTGLDPSEHDVDRQYQKIRD